MAWRPDEYLIDGELDNTKPGRVEGWLRFHGLDERVTVHLRGDFHRDIRGACLRLKGKDGPAPKGADRYMAGFSIWQTGDTGDITAGLLPRDYVDYPYVEWYGEGNGRVVLELEHSQVEVVGTPIPWETTQPISREAQRRNLLEFLNSVGVALMRGSSGGPLQ